MSHRELNEANHYSAEEFDEAAKPFDFDFSSPPVFDKNWSPYTISNPFGSVTKTLNLLEECLVDVYVEGLAPEVNAIESRDICVACEFQSASQSKHACMTMSQCWIDKKKSAFVIDANVMPAHRIACILQQHLIDEVHNWNCEIF